MLFNISFSGPPSIPELVSRQHFYLQKFITGMLLTIFTWNFFHFSGQKFNHTP